MPDQELHKDYPELMSRYLSGNATEAEVQQLEAWVLSDPEHRRQFLAFKKAWILSGMADDGETVDLDGRWRETAAQLFPEAGTVPMPARSYRWLGVAASIALVVGLAVWGLFVRTTEREMLVAAADQVQNVELPDGSTVTLNRSSSLRYTPVPAAEGLAAQRRIDLEGDAFFVVISAPDRPFIIANDALEVEVLGTAFYVDARADQPEIQVIVEAGRVAVRADTIVTLSAGEQAVYEKSSGRLIRRVNEDANYQSIQSGTLNFDDTPLAEVVFALQRHYGVQIDTSGITTTADCNLTGEYTGLSIDDIRAVLERSWGLETTGTNDRILLRGEACLGE